MNRDFTYKKYSELLQSLLNAGYEFVPFGDVCEYKQQHPQQPLPWKKFVMLRHDVDLKADNSLKTAKIESQLGIMASYYFRVIPQSNQPHIIKAISELGHEIGYHYEDMSITNGDKQKALEHFAKWLAYFRTYYPVKTICMHGAPMSKYDGRDLWKDNDYHSFGIIGEPYFDVDFNSVFYLTDTGRCWDGYRVSRRDKVPQQEEWNRQGKSFHRTDDIITRLPQMDIPQIMITTHPQRWNDNLRPWLSELVLQSVKNLIKYVLLWAKG